MTQTASMEAGAEAHKKALEPETQDPKTKLDPPKDQPITLSQPPGVGIHYGVPDKVYHRWEGLSSHRLNQLAEGDTPARLRYDMLHPKPPTDDQNIGTAAHYKVLEPDLFDKRVVKGLDHDHRSKANKASWATFEKENVGKIILKPEDYDKALVWGNNIMEHPAAAALREMAEAVELTLIWQFMGAWCKNRLDLWVPELEAIIDIKTGRETNDPDFEKAACNYGYHRQGGFYLEGANKCGLPAKYYILIVLEKAKPYWVKVRRMHEDMIWAGNDEMKQPKKIMAACYKYGEWPGYADEVETMNFPDWKIRQLIRDSRRSMR